MNVNGDAAVNNNDANLIKQAEEDCAGNCRDWTGDKSLMPVDNPYVRSAGVCMSLNQYSRAPSEIELGYDANGNLTSARAATLGVAPGDSIEPTRTFQYDYANRLVRYDDDDSANAGVVTLFAYDALGRRVQKTVKQTNDLGAVESSTVNYFFDGDQIIEETDDSLTAPGGGPFGGQTRAIYINGLYVDEPLQMRRKGAAGAPDSVYYFHRDDLYSVVALTDSTGAVAERYDYDDYGAPTFLNPDGSVQLKAGSTTEASNSSALNNRYLFTGREWDPELNLYFYRSRYYDPRMGRFTQMDSIGVWGDEGSIGNAYSYAMNHPLGHIDPFGQAPSKIIHKHRTSDGTFQPFTPDSAKVKKINDALKNVDRIIRRHNFVSLAKCVWNTKRPPSKDWDNLGELVIFWDLPPVGQGNYGSTVQDGSSVSIYMHYNSVPDVLESTMMHELGHVQERNGSIKKDDPRIIRNAEAVSTDYETWGAWVRRLLAEIDQNLKRPVNPPLGKKRRKPLMKDKCPAKNPDISFGNSKEKSAFHIFLPAFLVCGINKRPKEQKKIYSSVMSSTDELSFHQRCSLKVSLLHITILFIITCFHLAVFNALALHSFHISMGWRDIRWHNIWYLIGFSTPRVLFVCGLTTVWFVSSFLLPRNNYLARRWQICAMAAAAMASLYFIQTMGKAFMLDDSIYVHVQQVPSWLGLFLAFVTFPLIGLVALKIIGRDRCLRFMELAVVTVFFFTNLYLIIIWDYISLSYYCYLRTPCGRILCL